ncbi:MAG: peptide/nickel transport system substrate-binding protein [Pyrinomonadaceae bacterium]|jgi:peptide/nickel transport system substrate-binding protein|nr:peptide/nickel transport system substrate-binding protein [Pyrinomonadaceae bacterium]
MRIGNSGCGGRRATGSNYFTFTRCLLVAALLCLVLSGVSCKRAGGNAFVMVLEAGQKTLDPLRGTDAASERYRQLMFNQLMRKDPKFDYEGELASNVATAPDGLSVTFTLRDGVKFHDGKPLTSADVKYTFDKLFASDSPKALSFVEGAGANKQPLVTSIEAPDPRTVVFRLRRPWLELFANLIPIAIIPEGTFESQAIKPLGSGAFKFISYDESQQVVELEANEDYWEGAPNIKRLRVKVILDANTQQAELVAGRVDLAVNTALSPDAYVNLAKNQNLQVVQSPGVNVQYIGFNSESAPVNNPRVRQAIAYAIDRESIIKNLLQGQARLAHSILPQESWAYSTEQKTYNYDPAQAKKLLDEAGFTDPDGDGPRLRFAEPLSFKISASNSVVRQYAGVMQNSLREVGIPVNIETLEDNTLREAQRNGQYQLTAGRWVGGNQDPIFLRDLYTYLSGGNFNRGRYRNAELDKILGEAVATADRAKAKTLYAAAQDVISREVPMLPLWYNNNIVIARKNVGNIKVPAGADWTFVRSLTVSK